MLFRSPEVEVVGVVDPQAERAFAAIQAHGLDPGVHAETLEHLLARTPVELVVNLTPPRAHRAVIEAAFAAGCDVITEKPLASTFEDASALVRLSERTGRWLAVMQNRRYAPAIRRLGDEARAGAIGSLTQLGADMLMLPSHRSSYFGDSAHPLLTDMAIHTFDQARYLSGRDARRVVCHEFGPWTDGRPVNAVATFELDDNVAFSYRGSWSTPGHATSYDAAWRLSGADGTLLWDSWGEPSLAVRQSGDVAPSRDVQRWPVDDASGFDVCLRAMLGALVRGEPAETDSHDHLRSLAMVYAAIRSAEQRRWVDLDELAR